MKKFLRNPKISGFRVRFESGYPKISGFRVGFWSGYPKIFGFSGKVQVGLPENIRVFGSGSGRVGSPRIRPETRFFSGSIVWVRSRFKNKKYTLSFSKTQREQKIYCRNLCLLYMSVV